MVDGRYVLITGASGGLGRSLARLLEQEGWWLALAGRDTDRLQQAYPDSDHALVVGDASKARQKLSWAPAVSFKQLVQKMVDADLALLESP